MSSNKIKINDQTSIEFMYPAKDMTNNGVSIDNAIKITQTFDNNKVVLLPETLEAIYKEYKRKIFNDEMKEVIYENNN